MLVTGRGVSKSFGLGLPFEVKQCHELLAADVLMQESIGAQKYLLW